MESETGDERRTHAMDLKDGSLPIRPSRDDIITPVSDEEKSSWEELQMPSGSSPSSPFVAFQELSVAAEAYLHIEALLDDIRARRPNLFRHQGSRFPLYVYDLISLSDDGRMILLVLAFEKVEAAGDKRMVGVVLRIDLYTQHYEEVRWLKGSSLFLGDSLDYSLDCLAFKLACDFGKEQLNCDDFCVVSNNAVRCNVALHTLSSERSPVELVYG